MKERKFKKGDKYKLAYLYDLSARGYKQEILDFELLAFRGSKLYFFNQSKGKDLVISRIEFERLKEIADQEQS